MCAAPQVPDVLMRIRMIFAERPRLRGRDLHRRLRALLLAQHGGGYWL